MILKILEAA